jgi:hypothetical protein
MNLATQVGRLALRIEGDEWVAYYAVPDSMQGALRIGSIALGAVALPARKAGFLELMREVVGDIIEETTGTRPVWGAPIKAPEHERGVRP